MPRPLLLSMSCFLLTGCVLHTPSKVLRGTLDFNSERHLSAQVEAYDHLPLKPVRIKLMRWGYNVGPFPSGTGTLGLGTGRYTSCHKSGECEPGMMPGGVILPSPDVGPESSVPAPLVPPPAPPAELGARSNLSDVRMAGYRAGNAVPNAYRTAGWMFVTPKDR